MHLVRQGSASDPTGIEPDPAYGIAITSLWIWQFQPMVMPIPAAGIGDLSLSYRSDTGAIEPAGAGSGSFVGGGWESFARRGCVRPLLPLPRGMSGCRAKACLSLDQNQPEVVLRIAVRAHHIDRESMLSGCGENIYAARLHGRPGLFRVPAALIERALLA